MSMPETGLPPEKGSSLRYGFRPAGGRRDAEKETHGGGDRRQAAAGRRADITRQAGSGGGSSNWRDGGDLPPLADGVRRAEGQSGQAPEGTRGREHAATSRGVGPDAGQDDPGGGRAGKLPSPARRRACVEHVVAGFGVPEG